MIQQQLRLHDITPAGFDGPDVDDTRAGGAGAVAVSNSAFHSDGPCALPALLRKATDVLITAAADSLRRQAQTAAARAVMARLVPRS